MKKINLLVIIFLTILLPVIFITSVLAQIHPPTGDIPADEINEVPPTPPTSVTASGINDSTIKISWHASTGATSYNIYRSDTRDGSFVKIYTLEQLSELSYENTGLPKGTTKYYYVTAVNENGESRYSQTVSASTTNSSLIKKLNSLKKSYSKSFTKLETQLSDEGKAVIKINKDKSKMRESDSTMLLQRVVQIRGNVTEAKNLIADNVTVNTIEEYNTLKAQLKKRVKWIKDRIKGVYKEIPYYKKIKGFRDIEVVINKNLQDFHYNNQCKDQWDALELARTNLRQHLERSENLISTAWTNPGDPDKYSFNYKPTSDELKLVSKSARDANRYLKYILKRCRATQ
ncbi:MAG TPA: fibronectin type III domain-containing protein [bacterium]|nr:fibronectin type III domain-containing protein [bacterium]